MADPSPLQPREFFRGVWTGAGELIPHPLLRWIAPKLAVHMTSTPTWLSDTVWVVHDRFVFSSGQVIDRKMFAELAAPDRIHVTADDIPGGVDIHLHEHGFRFTPYYVCTRHRGIPLRLRCIDDNRIDATGAIHDLVRMYFFGIRVATLRIGPIERKR